MNSLRGLGIALGLALMTVAAVGSTAFADGWDSPQGLRNGWHAENVQSGFARCDESLGTQHQMSWGFGRRGASFKMQDQAARGLDRRGEARFDDRAGEASNGWGSGSDQYRTSWHSSRHVRRNQTRGLGNGPYWGRD